MKKVTRIVALVLVAMFALTLLTACGVGSSDAEKINQAANDDKHYTYDDLVKKYGTPTVDTTLAVGSVRGGLVTWVNGCKDSDDLKEKKEEKHGALIVTILNNKAISATYTDDYFNVED